MAAGDLGIHEVIVGLEIAVFHPENNVVNSLMKLSAWEYRRFTK
jgi:hypothetical protein